MEPPSDDRRIAELQQALGRLERRVSQLETGAANSGFAAAVPHRESHSEHESRTGLKLVNRAGVVTLVLGLAFLFRWAVDNNWIGPTVQVFLGALCGLATLALAEMLWRKQQQVFGEGISAVGIAILFFDAYAAFEIYKFIPQSVAFVCLYTVIAVAAYLARRYASGIVSASALIAAFLTPLLLLSSQHLLSRCIALSAAFVFFHYFNWDNRLLLSLNGIAYLGIMTGLLQAHHRTALVLTGIVVSACFFARRTQAAYYTAHLLLLWTLSMQIFFWADQGVAAADRVNTITFALSLLYTLYGMVLIGIGVSTGAANNRFAGLALLGAVIAKLYLFDVYLLGRVYRITAFVALGVLLIAASYFLRNTRTGRNTEAAK